MYWQLITTIEAENALLSMKIADYPYSPKSIRAKFFKEIKQLSKKNFYNKNKSKEMSLKDLALALSGGKDVR